MAQHKKAFCHFVKNKEKYSKPAGVLPNKSVPNISKIVIEIK
jgi:hypothetical protein